MRGDGRSLRVALTSDAIVNAVPDSPAEAVLRTLVDEG